MFIQATWYNITPKTVETPEIRTPEHGRFIVESYSTLETYLKTEKGVDKTDIINMSAEEVIEVPNA